MQQKGTLTMKRLHVSLGVEDLEASVRFYSTLFGVEPTVRRDGYAKWMLDDPRVNFVLDQKGADRGVDHLGIQVEDESELSDLSERLGAAGQDVDLLKDNKCCYARQDKFWVSDPQGVPWEAFKTHELIEEYGTTTRTKDLLESAKASKSKGGCC